MTDKEFIAAIRAARAELQETLPAEALRMAQDGLTLTKGRVQRSGINAEGQSYEGYSPIYAKYGRLALGYQADYVDFTRRGRMWASIQPFLIESRPNYVEVEIKAADDENQTKLNGQFAKRGNILEWDEQTVEAVRAANNLRVEKILQKHLG